MNAILRRPRIASAVLALGCFGCSGGDGRQAVDGAVTLDGEPLNEGVISFVPQEKDARRSGSTIVDGEYAIPAKHGLTPGEYAVVIDSADGPGSEQVIPSLGVTAPVSRIPPRYNGATELTATVEATRDNRFDFNLLSR